MTVATHPKRDHNFDNLPYGGLEEDVHACILGTRGAYIMKIAYIGTMGQHGSVSK